MDMITRDAARSAGLKHYRDGVPCSRGHVSGRYVSIMACRECISEDDRAKRLADPEAYREKRARWLAANPEKARQYEARKKANNPEAYRARMRRASWRFRDTPLPTRPEPPSCECCGRAETMVRKGSLCHLQVDHDHATGLFRGWLCSSCNLGLGKIGDTIEAVERLLAYLKRAQEQWSPTSPNPSMTSTPKSDS